MIPLIFKDFILYQIWYLRGGKTNKQKKKKTDTQFSQAKIILFNVSVNYFYNFLVECFPWINIYCLDYKKYVYLCMYTYLPPKLP